MRARKGTCSNWGKTHLILPLRGSNAHRVNNIQVYRLSCMDISYSCNAMFGCHYLSCAWTEWGKKKGSLTASIILSKFELKVRTETYNYVESWLLNSHLTSCQGFDVLTIPVSKHRHWRHLIICCIFIRLLWTPSTWTRAAYSQFIMCSNSTDDGQALKY